MLLSYMASHLYGAQLLHRYRAHAHRVSSDRATMVVHLAEVIREMREEMNGEELGRHRPAGDLLRILGVPLYCRDRVERGVDRFPARVESGEHFGARHGATSELSVAVANETRVAESGSEEVLEISGEVQREVAAGVRNAFHLDPE